IPTLGALALAAQRLMPLLQQVYLGWVAVTGGRRMVADVGAILRQPVEPGSIGIGPLPFNDELRFDNVSFRYGPQLPTVLNRLNFSIVKGGRVGLIGPTGSGKST